MHVIYESPINCHLCAKYENVFNFSASYRLDSDFSSIYWTDSSIYWAAPNEQILDSDVFSTKTNFSAILISNCRSNSLREKYLSELKQYIPVDVYGNCGTLNCPKSEENVTCREYIGRKYKFYLAFENSMCNDYVTEKLFDTLHFNIIPVVYGYANYSYYLPKSGYINALDFETPKQLAEYMLYLDKNKSMYNDYFKWKRYIRIDENPVVGGFLCEMCIKLNLEENLKLVEHKQLNDLRKSFGLIDNCFNVSFSAAKSFVTSKLTRNIYSYFMSPESYG